MVTEERTEGSVATETSAAPAGEGPPFVFYSPELKQRLDLLRHLVENSEMIPLLKGPADAGKSTLIHELFRNAREVWQPALLIADSTLQPEQFLLALADAFSLQGSENYLLDSLLRRFENLHLDGNLAVVVVDDAHLLPEATLALILEMHGRAPRDVRFLLFAEPSVENLLAPLRGRNLDLQPLQELEMPRLTRDQTKQYVEKLLLARGGAEQQKLTDAQMERICRESDGLPGKITRLADEIGATRLNGWLKKVSPVQMAGLALAVVLVLMLLIFQDSINALFGGDEDEQMVVETQEPGREIPLQLPPQTPEKVPAPEAELEAEEVVQPQPVETPTPEPTLESVEPAEPSEVAAEEATEDYGPLPVLEAVPSEPAADEAAPPAEATETETESQESPQQTAESSAPPAPEPKPEESVRPTPAVAESPVAEKPVEAPKPAPVKEPTPKQVDSGGIKSEAWLLLQNPASYTLQLAGMQDKAGVPRMVELYKLPGPFAYYHTSRNGGPWYPVLYGVYPSHKAALAARDKLAASHGLKGAWVRSFSSIQREIRAQ